MTELLVVVLGNDWVMPKMHHCSSFKFYGKKIALESGIVSPVPKELSWVNSCGNYSTAAKKKFKWENTVMETCQGHFVVLSRHVITSVEVLSNKFIS